ncbi:hypothetical protein [Nostoc sp.]|uniref:hypothetical protein n=1 Tax=Nostoc sp. TaxID=1180 RepID=UPI002FFD2BBB
MKLLKTLFSIGTIPAVVSAVIIAPGLVATAVDYLDTAYIRPTTLVYSSRNFQTYADNAFDGYQKAVIGPAAKLLHERLNNDQQRAKVINCACSRSSKDFPTSRKAIDDQLKQVFVNSASGNRPIKMTVTYLKGLKNVVGRGIVGDSGQFPEKGDLLRIALSSDYFGSQSSVNNGYDYWANVMAHEVLHNLGYKHPTGYPGSFVEEFGICVQFNGEQPAQLGLTDSDVYDGKEK